jgi:hypothetical protein
MPHGSRVAHSIGAVYILIFLLIADSGCSSKTPDRMEQGGVDAKAAGAAAIAEYDTNHDGAISGAELDKSPGLKAALKSFDNAGDGKVTADTIAGRIGLWQQSKAALVNVGVVIMLDGQPLPNAAVTMVPEKFLGPNVSQAKGTTNTQGVAAMNVDGKKGAGFGLYRVEVSLLANGQEALPAKYNKNTELGLEVSPDMFAHPGLPVFDLKSR